MGVTNTCVVKSILLFVLVIVTFVIIYTYTQDKSDKFSNLDVNKLAQLGSPYPSGTVPTNILTDYDKLLTPDFISRLNNSGARAEENYKSNNSIISQKLNQMDTNINNMLSEVNKSLYEQLGENYARSQQINSVRQDWLQDIDELPYKVIS